MESSPRCCSVLFAYKGRGVSKFTGFVGIIICGWVIPYCGRLGVFLDYFANVCANLSLVIMPGCL